MWNLYWTHLGHCFSLSSFWIFLYHWSWLNITTARNLMYNMYLSTVNKLSLKQLIIFTSDLAHMWLILLVIQGWFFSLIHCVSRTGDWVLIQKSHVEMLYRYWVAFMSLHWEIKPISFSMENVWVQFIDLHKIFFI